MRRWLLVAILAVLPLNALSAAPIMTLNKVTVEGGLLVGKVDPGTVVTLDGEPVPVSSGGDFVLGFGRDSAGDKTVVARRTDGAVEQRIVSIIDRSFKIDRIDGLPRRKVTPDPADVQRIGAEKAAIAAARQAMIDTPFFTNGFVWPAVGRISGVYGSQRILNGQPRRPHYGTDIAAPVGTQIRAMADGKVTFTHPGMFFNGKTVMIDHGLGLRSVYIHMSEVSVEVGQILKAGEPIGAIGVTGRTTGPHLHFGLEWGSVPIDPEVVLGPMPE